MTHRFTRRRLLTHSILAAGTLALPDLVTAGAGGRNAALPVGRRMQPVNPSQVKITDTFWRRKQEKVATVTLKACIHQIETATGRIRNFEKAARRTGELHEGIYFDDSDVYKALEAIAYSLNNRPDAALERKADEWIDKVAAAQLPDGYLHTYTILTAS
jgi:DUF1680 family protein